MSLIGRILGTDEAIKAGIDTVASGLDALVYTDEEKAQDHAKAVTEARSMLVGWMEASQGHRLARRIIALSITFSWLALVLVTLGLGALSIVFESTQEFAQIAEITSDSMESMQGAVMLILAFYFAAPHIGDIVKPAMDKFSKS